MNYTATFASREGHLYRVDIVHAATPSSGVRVNSLNETYYANRYLGARRIIVN